VFISQNASMGFGPLNTQAYGLNNPMGGTAQMSSMLNMMMSVMQMISQMFLFEQMQTMMSPSAQFGARPSGAGMGLGNFLGNSSGNSSRSSSTGPGSARSVGGSNGPVRSSNFGSVPGWGAALAKDAAKHATGPGGYCFRYVRQALERAGVKGVGGASAYMAADQLAKNPRFREIRVNPKDLPKLPAGAVVVWDRGGSGATSAGKIHGHISIALGNGKEVSDRIRNQTTSMGSRVRVFLPK
jgi:hypothetical protein